jgi:hypothetical protein
MKSRRDPRSGVTSLPQELTKVEDRIFTGRRVGLYGTGAAVAYALSLAWRLPDGRVRCVDFGWMWLSGEFAVSAIPAQIFDYSTFSAAQIALLATTLASPLSSLCRSRSVPSSAPPFSFSLLDG